MALKLHAIKNNSGQALVETLLLTLTAGAFLFFLLRYLLLLIFTVALDSMAEDYFFCELAHKANCLSRLESKLNDNQMREIKISTESSENKIVLTLTAKHLVALRVKREFNYENFRQKF